MTRDERVIIMGQDLRGNVFGAATGALRGSSARPGCATCRSPRP